GRRRIAGGWVVTSQLCPRNSVTRTTILNQGERAAYCSNIGGPLRFAGGEIASCAVHYKSGKGDKQEHQDCCEDECLTATPSHFGPVRASSRKVADRVKLMTEPNRPTN